MKTYRKIFVSFLLVCCFTQLLKAQTEPTIEKADWELITSSGLQNSVNGHSNKNNLIKLGNGLTAALVKNDKSEFAVATIGDDMQFRWRTALPGVPFAMNWFKGKLLVVAASSKSYFKTYENNYSAFLLDPATGRLLLQKQIYKGSEDFIEFPNFFFSETGDFFKFSVRVSGIKRKVHIGLPIPGIGAMLAVSTVDKQFEETQSFTIFNVDEKLDTKALVADLPKGIIINVLSNNLGDLFLLSIKDANSLIASKYEDGKKVAVKQITQPFDVQLKKPSYASLASNIYITDCLDAPQEICWTMMVDEGDGTTLYVSKLDFETETYKFQRERFTKQVFSTLEKGYVNINKKVSDPNLGSANYMRANSMFDAGDKIVVAVGGIYIGQVFKHYSEILNVYNTDLKLLYQQLIPNQELGNSTIGYHYFADNTLSFITDLGNGTLFGKMDLKDGKMLKLVDLGKSKISNNAYLRSAGVIWNDKNFIVPYFDVKGLTQSNYDVSLKKFAY